MHGAMTRASHQAGNAVQLDFGDGRVAQTALELLGEVNSASAAIAFPKIRLITAGVAHEQLDGHSAVRC